MLVPKPLRRVAAAALFAVLLLGWHILRPEKQPEFKDVRHQYPMLLRYIEGKKGNGGAWHFPQEWTQDSSTNPPLTIIGAANLALNITSLPQRQLPRSAIPRIIHQTWKDTRLETWPTTFRDSAEKWLTVVDEGELAYMFWDDAGVAQFIRYFEPNLEAEFYALPTKVEQSDVFRVLVCKWLGGVYVDMDTEPLQSPMDWISQFDTAPWTDLQTGRTYQSSEPVRAIVGIEADNPPDTDTYWRMGYFYPVQLTQWAFAWAPQHPILSQFIDHIFNTVRKVAHKHDGDLNSEPTQQELAYLDPVNVTGPIAFTDSVSTWLTGKADLRWNAVTGLNDGGQSKFVEDVLVLPITGFSPGRGKYGNMGSKPVTDPAARLYHHAQGSWRSISISVELGKFCRTAFGLCRDWSKVSHGGFFS
ncbi:hypothetical protein BJX63DRAFT_445054 [Aspergillus granulosus]|uniref:Glycosyl transferase n=1 Tax=Aspergillus granulosus TaxID=176169 RepID=A0ABR4H387_9EURO